MHRSPSRQPGDAGHGDHRSTLTHQLDGLASAQEGAARVDGHHLGERCVAHQGDLGTLPGHHLIEAVTRQSADPGVVDLHVESTPGPVDLGEHRDHVALVGHVAAEGPVAVSIQQLDGLVGGLPAEVLGGDRGALLGKTQRHGPPQPGTGPRDTGHLPGQATLITSTHQVTPGGRRTHRRSPRPEQGPNRPDQVSIRHPLRRIPRASVEPLRVRPGTWPTRTTQPSGDASRRRRHTRHSDSRRLACRRV